MKISTEHFVKPVPVRFFDWEAIDSDTYEAGCPVGYGHTEAEAVDDLVNQLIEKEDVSWEVIWAHLSYKQKYIRLAKALCRLQGIDPNELISDAGHEAWELVAYEVVQKEIRDHG